MIFQPKPLYDSMIPRAQGRMPKAAPRWWRSSARRPETTCGGQPAKRNPARPGKPGGPPALGGAAGGASPWCGRDGTGEAGGESGRQPGGGGAGGGSAEGRSGRWPMGALAPAQCARGGGARAVRNGPGRGAGAAARAALWYRHRPSGVGALWSPVPLRPARGPPAGEAPPGRRRRRGAEALRVRVVVVVVVVGRAPAARCDAPGGSCPRIAAAWKVLLGGQGG